MHNNQCYVTKNSSLEGVYEDSVSEQVVHWPKKGARKLFLETVFKNSAFDVKGFDVKHLIN